MPITAAPGRTGKGSDVAGRLAFFKGLQAITTRIDVADDVDRVVLDLSADLCALFDADSLCFFALDEAGTTLVSRVRTGAAPADARLPVEARNIAGYVALSRQPVNIRDVHDQAELCALSPELRFPRSGDERSGYRTRQMLAAPVIDPASGALQGVILLINATQGENFSSVAKDGLLGLAQALGVAYAQSGRAPAALRSRNAALVAAGRLGAA